jgi:hypothetical protein
MAGVDFALKMDRGFDLLKKALEAARARGSYAKAGVIGSGKPRTGGGVTNVLIAAVHEFGSPENGIPERAPIRTSFAAHRAEYLEMLRSVVKSVYQLKGGLEPGLGRIGAKMAADIKRGITSGPGLPPPLAPETVERKGSDRPLVDTGQYVNSITWEVVLRGSR